MVEANPDHRGEFCESFQRKVNENAKFVDTNVGLMTQAEWYSEMTYLHILVSLKSEHSY